MITVILMSFCLSLVLPLASGMSICTGADGHTAIISIDAHDCCPPELHCVEGNSVAPEPTQVTTKDCCVDVSPAIDAGAMGVTWSQNKGFKSASFTVVTYIPCLVRAIRTRNLVAICAFTRMNALIAVIGTTVLQV